MLGCVVAGAGLAWHRRSSAESSGQLDGLDGLDPGTTVMVANPLFTRASWRQQNSPPRLPTTTTESTPAEADMAAGLTFAVPDANQTLHVVGGHHVRTDHGAHARLGESPSAKAEMDVTATFEVLDSSQTRYVVGGHHARTDHGASAPAEAGLQTAPTYAVIDSSQQYAAVGHRHPQTNHGAYARLGRTGKKTVTGVLATAELAVHAYGVLDDGLEYASAL